jgi:hypothetical protein
MILDRMVPYEADLQIASEKSVTLHKESLEKLQRRKTLINSLIDDHSEGNKKVGQNVEPLE